MNPANPWTAVDNARLRQLLGTAPVKVIARRLGRSEGATSNHMGRLRINQRTNAPTIAAVSERMNELCRCERCSAWTWLTVMIHEPKRGERIAVVCLKCLSLV